MTTPYSFDEFFASNQEETISPFLTPSSRKWGKNLPLRSSILAAILLAIAFSLSFIHPIGSTLTLSCVYLLVGTPALINSLKDLSRFDINIDVLMTLAALLSVVIGSELEGALLLVLFELSAGIEILVSEKTRSSVINLNRLSPRSAAVIGAPGHIKGHLTETSVQEIPVGTLILVKAGEIIPLDGVVVEGRSYVNLVHLTGESAPLSKQTGDEVPAGAGNLDGTLTVRVTRTIRDSTLSRIIRLITDAQASKPKVEQFLDRFGKVYASSIILLSAFFAFTLPHFTALPFLGPEGSIYRALAFLIAASPCALILATPTAYLSAISSCARRGVLLKGGIVLDAVKNCTMVALDKTGTLTTGELICTAQKHLFGPALPPEKALFIAASLERNAVHPIAKALVDLAKQKNIPLSHIDNFRALSGFGLEGDDIAIGHRDFIQQKTTFTLPPAESMSTFLFAHGSIVLFQFQDAVRPQTAETITALKQENLRVVMLTGDHLINAKPVAAAVGIDEVYADLRPEDKLQKITELAKQNDLMMVGDGINDAPALARATVGVSMGKIGSATAVDASDIILIHDDLKLLSWLVKKAHKTRHILTQNITLALIVILFATTPALLGLVPLWIAVILHEGGTVLVGLNSLRLLKK